MPEQQLYRIELKIEDGEKKVTLLPVFATSLSADVAVPGNLVMDLSEPLPYKGSGGVFLADKVSTPAGNVESWQFGRLVIPELVPDPPPKKGRRKKP